MKLLKTFIIYVVVLSLILYVNSLFFTHHQPEVQLAFISPGLIILGYSIFRDRFYIRPKIKYVRER
jgi:hypothetical protein